MWTRGLAFTFNGFSRTAFAKTVDAGGAEAVFTGNAMAAHDLESAYFHTALGQDVETQENRPLGHGSSTPTRARRKPPTPSRRPRAPPPPPERAGAHAGSSLES
ncbi:ornithine cyclodeaminase family domain [Gordonibacter pamelaeae]|uniref:ornithine cyclodeaminase family domain n=1 Tax=Gordonibacter pamelaeae TaxID=471189 RepID=UPI0031195403